MATMQPNLDPGDPPRVRITDPADLIAAVPAMLGFRPHRSVVVICLAGDPTVVQAVLRADLPDPAAHDGAALVDHLVERCARADCERAVAVIVDDRLGGAGPDDPLCNDPLCDDPDGDAHGVLLDLLADVLAEIGVELVSGYLVTDLVADAAWWTLLGDPDGGPLPDPGASEIAATQVLRGHPIRASRAELVRLLAPRPPAERTRVARLRSAARHPSSRARRRPVGAVIEEVVARIVDAGGSLGDEAIAAVSVALERFEVRDALLGLVVTDAADAAETAWLGMVRALTGPERAEPAALLGFSAYVRGDGPLAGVALGLALTADPEHRLAGMLDAALYHGVRPDALVRLAHTGREVAATLGATLPPAA